MEKAHLVFDWKRGNRGHFGYGRHGLSHAFFARSDVSGER